ncbi:hypothetical protein Tcan_00245 [Toxocara canis]|uniref:Uncharacterized protein n=1 Tax=Toxocara canis TaxID=6265 RepID=A0A0B2V0Y6_TOXCA|nr:hypothetical protein Tcan_00245 [Toxocara canis]
MDTLSVLGPITVRQPWLERRSCVDHVFVPCFHPPNAPVRCMEETLHFYKAINEAFSNSFGHAALVYSSISHLCQICLKPSICYSPWRLTHASLSALSGTWKGSMDM